MHSVRRTTFFKWPSFEKKWRRVGRRIASSFVILFYCSLRKQWSDVVNVGLSLAASCTFWAAVITAGWPACNISQVPPLVYVCTNGEVRSFVLLVFFCIVAKIISRWSLINNFSQHIPLNPIISALFPPIISAGVLH